MAIKLEVKNLYKIFGEHPQRAFKYIEKGLSKEQILEKTGLRTPEYEEALAWTRNITVEQLREGYTKNAIPIGRAGRLAEVADFVCYLLSERASYITGVTTNIAGGKTRG